MTELTVGLGSIKIIIKYDMHINPFFFFFLQDAVCLYKVKLVTLRDSTCTTGP